MYRARSDSTLALTDVTGSVPAGDGVYQLQIATADGDTRFYSCPGNGTLTWTGLWTDIGDDSAVSTSEYLKFAVKHKPAVGLYRVAQGVTESTLLGRLRVAKQVGAGSGPRFMLAVLFKGHQLATVHACIKSLFPDAASTHLGTAVEDNCAPRAFKQPVRDNVEYMFFCHCTDDHAVEATRLNKKVVAGNRLGCVIAPANKKRPGYRDGELNPVLPFRIWFDPTH
jgi:hypothetical protein